MEIEENIVIEQISFSLHNFCSSISLTDVDRKMQILFASFKVLFQQVFNWCGWEDADFIC